MTSTPVAKRAEVATRRTQAIELALSGRTWDQVAEELGYSSRGAAYTDIKRALAFYVREQHEGLDLLRAQQLAKLDAIEARMWAIMTADHPLVQGGKVVYADVEVEVDGVKTTKPVPLNDVGPTMAAADRLLKIESQRSDLLGTRAPVRVQQETTVRYEIFGFDMSQLR